MSIQPSVGEIVKMFGDTYGALDVRTAAVREEDAWVNALTVVRLTYEEPSAVMERLGRLEERHGRAESKNFRIVMHTRPFAEWKAFCDELASGVLRFKGLDIKLCQPVAVDAERNQLQSFLGDIRPFDGVDWPALKVYIGPHRGTELSDETLARQIAYLGYADPYEAINALCEVNVAQGRSYGYDLYVAAPIFIRVMDGSVTSIENRLDVTVKRHQRLSDINGLVDIRHQNYDWDQPPRARLRLTTFETSGDELITTAITPVKLPGVKLDDWVHLKLIHAEIGEIGGSFLRQIRSLIPSAERNVLFEALKHFCPDAQLEALLTRPHEVGPRKLGASAAFELHVAWVLSLYGLATIVLGRYEHILAPGTNVQRASVDILAAMPHDNTLLIVGCTLGTTKEEDFGNLSNVRGILEREVFARTSVRILPVLFTAARGCAAYKEAGGFLSYIPVIDADGLETVLQLLCAGMEESFLRFLNNPAMSPLRKP